MNTRRRCLNSINTSPMRVVIKALTAAFRADGFPNQNPINKYEHRPMISQPTKSVSRLSETTSVYIPNANRLIKAKKREYMGSMDGTECACPFPDQRGTMRGKPGNIMIALWLTEIMVANAVDKNCKHSPGHKKDDHWQRADRSAPRSLSQVDPVGSQLMEEPKICLPNSFTPRARIKINMLPNHDRPAAPTAMLWLKAFLLFVNRIIAKKDRSGGRGNSQMM